MLKRGFGKKGAEETTTQVGFILIGLILAGIVVLGSLRKTVDDVNGTTLEKNYIARDIALALDAVYAAPGDIEYTYSMKNYKFVVEIKGSRVFVKKLDEEDSIAGVYDYFGDPDSKLNVRILPPPPSPDEKDTPPMLVKLKNKNDVVLVDAGGSAHLDENVVFT
jgi:hypothetical protein